jgi:hypothetical protein
MENLAELRAREAEVSREWQWLHDALNAVARARAEIGDAAAFQLMQARATRVGQRRVELSCRSRNWKDHKDASERDAAGP